MKKGLLLTGTAATLALVLGACGSKPAEKKATESKQADETVTIKLSALEPGYGKDMWPAIIAEYEKQNPKVKVELQQDKKIDDILAKEAKGDMVPDIVMLSFNKSTPKSFVQNKAVADLSDVLDMTVPGESAKVKDKIEGSFLDNVIIKPYDDGKPYGLPMFYSPTGLFYSKSMFKEKGWEVPKTWDEFFALGEKAKADNIALFTVATEGYTDTVWPAVLASQGGLEAYKDVTEYKKGAWTSEAGNKAFEIFGKLAQGTHPDVPGNVGDGFKLNQQLLIDKKALFMPNGSWVVGEMKETTPKDFEWGFMAYPAAKEGGDHYAYAYFEQIWMPAKAKHAKQAKEFLAFLYSDKAVEIFAKHSAVQPVKDFKALSTLDAANQTFYSIYKDGAKSVAGGFKATEPIEGVSLTDTLYKSFYAVVNGSESVADWQKAVVEVSDKLAEKVLKK